MPPNGATVVGVCAGECDAIGPPKRGCDALRLSTPAGPPGKPDTGDEVSKPLSWAEVYICGAWFPDTVVSGLPFA